MKLHKLLIIFSLLFLSSLGLQAQNEELIQLSYANPQIFKIAAIEVEGDQFLDDATIISLSGLQIGDEITIPGDAMSNAIKKIWKQKLVGDVDIIVTKVVGYEVYLTILLKERARLSNLLLEGVKKSERSDLEEQLGFANGQVVSDPLIKNTTISIKRYFKDKGFYNVEVKHTKIKDVTHDNHVIVKYEVNKGKKVKVYPLNIIGNEVISDKKIKKKIKNTKEKNGARIFKRSKYIDSDYKEDKSAVIAYYNSLGYRDAQITKDSIYGVSKDLIGIDLHIREGIKYYFRDITWVGNQIHSDAELNSILDIKKGDIYNQEELSTRLNFNMNGPDVSSLYLDDGYLFFSVNPVEVRVDGDSIDLEMRIYEGAQATISRVTLAGNTKTNDHVLLREIRTLPGEKFSRADLIRTQREIAALGYFDPELIGITPVPNPVDGTVDINYSVVEKPSDQLQLSGGWGGAAGFVGTVGLAFNNFSLRNITNLKTWDPLPSGDGQRLSLRVQANGRFYQSYSLSFTEPWLGGKKPISLSVSLSHSVQNFTTNGEKSFIKINGLTLGLGKRLKWPDNYFTLMHNISFQNYDILNYDRGGFGCETCLSNNLSYGITVARNNVGINPQFPTRGSNISVSAKFTPPYKLLGLANTETAEVNSNDVNWIEYHKWMFDNSWFLKLTGNRSNKSNSISGTDEKKTERPLVLNLRVHFGYLASYGSESVGPFERFQLGGDGLSGAGSSFFLGTDIIGLRGYENSSITDVRDVDGVFYNKFVSELRFPIVTQGVATIYVLGFLEAGNNWSNPNNINPYDMYRSTGFGARIFMPAFGMLGVDWGYALDEIPGRNDSRSQVHFIIGQQLR